MREHLPALAMRQLDPLGNQFNTRQRGQFRRIFRRWNERKHPKSVALPRFECLVSGRLMRRSVHFSTPTSRLSRIQESAYHS